MRLGLVLPAAGRGERLSAPAPKQILPKQFRHIAGRSLLSHTINAFESLQDLVWIILLVPEEMMDKATSEVDANVISLLKDKLTVAAGCETRHRTIARGVAELDRHKIDVTIIHDAVRPVVHIPLLEKLVAGAAKFGASGPVSRLTSTVVSVDESGFLDHVLNRGKYYDSQMPQAFRQDVIREAYENCLADDLDNGTECLDLAKRYSSRKIAVKLVEADPNLLWKVTYRKDLFLTLMALNPAVDKSAQLHLLTEEEDLLDQRRRGIVTSVAESLSTFFDSVTKTSLRGSNGFTARAGNELRSAMHVVLRFSSSLEEFAFQVRELESSSESFWSFLLIIVFESNGEHGSMTPFFSELQSIVNSDTDSRASAIVYFLNHSLTESRREEKRIRFQNLIHFLVLKGTDFAGQILFV